ncbi:UDP-N-acetylglucosamine 4-epimerase [Roseibium aquae]|uniref:UDP-N-acetylglucosamine 4-epimerase n=1 Tax=Roseibium aquae TaxID=1323746 RepID=A0A916TN97_9HYPH|nr:NAD-dependent epimerase/dehydratase family protein [Roseibium aquae]GGB63995.1 UDP-N-acetylglucosamine 4-epimerase [Roseibium aquae]
MVLGTDGFLGSHMACTLKDRGVDVVEVGRAAGDFSTWDVVEGVFSRAPKVDRIFHLITQQRTGQVQYGIQGRLLQVNASIHLNVLEAWRLFQPQAKLISTGSSCAFPELDRPIVESDFQSGPMHTSVAGYGLAKQMLAVGSDAFAKQYGLTYLHLILATVYGPFDHKESDRTHFMTGMIDRAVKEKAAGKPHFSVWGSPNVVRDLLYVDDQLDAMLEADATFENRMLNCSSNAPVTIGACAEAIRTGLDWQVDIVYPPDTFKGTDYKTLDARVFLEESGWKPKVRLADGTRRILDIEYR